MFTHLTSRMPPGGHAHLKQILKEFYDALGPFVAPYPDCDQAGSCQTSRVADGTRVTVAATGADLGAILRGQHVRAGRALLNWSMSDLADASSLSMSTIRRLEQDAACVLTRNRRSAAVALQGAGVGFLCLSSGAIAVVQLTDHNAAPRR